MNGLVTVLTALMSGSFVLAGVLVAQRHQTRLADKARAEERWNTQRRLLAELIAAGWEMQNRFRAAMAAHGNDQMPREDRLNAWRHHEAIAERFERLHTEASLFIGDTVLIRLLSRISQARLGWHGEAVTVWTSPDSIRTDSAKLEEFLEALVALQDAAAALFRLPAPVREKGSGQPLHTNT